ncbi:unnamed protein product (macronuclear) [Paramecium tetraurelia]|uniref:C2H2-type domain-containing protein n=1 Tax=Paramecium tetraurelia TaxID=5888 RepID=A0E307_PARTE|nr:uncharacterized protein GSPATT00022847001 [Paramecium tetraurelia]CAK89674.1 unnamed protein product [Paramecium tetraurelia]|eukprot:XP_001457071.1 hypothetical protein (macronuclear) [Paramecium tetraurelia strain d4-2]
MQYNSDSSVEIILIENEKSNSFRESKNNKAQIKKLFQQGMNLIKKDEVLKGSPQIYELAKRKLISWKKHLKGLLKQHKDEKIVELLEKKRKALSQYERSGIHPDVVVKKGYWVVFMEYRWECRKCKRQFMENKYAKKHMAIRCFKGESNQKSEEKQVIIKKIFKRA